MAINGGGDWKVWKFISGGLQKAGGLEKLHLFSCVLWLFVPFASYITEQKTTNSGKNVWPWITFIGGFWIWLEQCPLGSEKLIAEGTSIPDWRVGLEDHGLTGRRSWVVHGEDMILYTKINIIYLDCIPSYPKMQKLSSRWRNQTRVQATVWLIFEGYKQQHGMNEPKRAMIWSKMIARKQ